MLSILKNRQVLLMFMSAAAILFVGMGLFPILPLYAATFQASNSMIGLFFSIMYAANALGPVLTAALASRFSTRTLFIAGSMTGLPALFLLGKVDRFALVILLTALVWFSGGFVMSLISIRIGHYTDENSRGKAFSLLAMVGPLGSLAGGATVGLLVTHKGYPLMFTVLALVWTIIPLLGWLGLRESPRAQAKASHGASSQSAGSLNSSFVRIMVITFLGSMALNVSRLGTSLSMQAASFTPDAVSSASMISGLVAIPFTLAIGTLSDRLGSKHFLFVSYLFTTSAALILANATQIWQYWLASILQMLAFSVSGAMAQALTAQVLPAQTMSKGLSWVNTLQAGSNIVCFAIGGIMFDLLSLPVVFLTVALLALASSAVIETTIRQGKPAPAAKEYGKA